jgi:PIN domain nuclease of toxin-antitoxin system
VETVVHLDTHVLVWLYAGEVDRFPKESRERIERATLAISPAAILELEYLFEIRRITERADVVVRDLSGRIGVRVDDAPFAAVVAAATTFSWTRDPFDRLIVAHAKTRDVALITADKTIRKHFSSAVWDRKRGAPARAR